MSGLTIKDTFVTLQCNQPPHVGETFVCTGKDGMYGQWTIGLVHTQEGNIGRLVASMRIASPVMGDGADIQMETFSFVVGE